MIDRIFPRQIDNRYRGHRIALWLLALLIAVKLVMGVNSVVNTRSVATGADGIAIDTLSADAAATMLRLFAAVALGQLVLTLQALLALVRYRAMVPLVYLLLTVEHLGRRALALAFPAEPSATVPVGLYLNLGMLAALLIGLLLSVMKGPKGLIAGEKPL
jgi:uncharacterized membrane protein